MGWNEHTFNKRSQGNQEGKTGMKAEKVGIGMVTVLYNPKEEYIRNIKQFCIGIDCALIVDNSPTSNEDLVRKTLSTEITVIYLYQDGLNLGLCKAINIGMDELIKHGYEWGLYIDQDSRYCNDILPIYRKLIESKKESHRIGVIGPQHEFDRRRLKRKSGYKEKEWLMTSGCIFNLKVFDSIGGFDERIFLDGLDVEYCLRCRKHEYKVIQCREAIVHHHPANTRELNLGILKLKYGWDKPERYYYKIRADKYINTHYKTWYCIGDMIIKYFKIIFLFDEKKRYLKAFKKGIKDAQNGVFGKNRTEL